MRLYLSSFRLGDYPEELRALAGDGARRAAVIANAIDDRPEDLRRDGVQLQLTALAGLGFEPAELDLRDYFGEQERLRANLNGVQLAWLCGGNVFLLRYVLRRSGGDTVLRDLVNEDALVYAGYSAGACVLSPSLRGLELVDDPGVIERLYGAQPVWDGLGLLDRAFVPHSGSPGHPETAACELVAERYRADGTPFLALSDGQALVINGASCRVV
jgi:dipeptidase E